MQRLLVLLVLVVAMSLVACGGGDQTAGGGGAGGDAAAGEKVFSEVAAPACNTCHSLEADVTLVGPSLAKIGTEAGSMVSGQSAEDYLRESITDPGAFLVDGFGNLMPATYISQLTEQQIEDLVAYMLTLQ